jgi:hypothetical protein
MGTWRGAARGASLLARRRSALAVEDSNQRLRVPERVVHEMVIVLRSTETLPLLSASKITDEPRVEVGYASTGMPKGILSRCRQK